MPEICWAVFKRQAIRLRDWCIWLVDLFECTECFAKWREGLIQRQSEFCHKFRGTFCIIKFIPPQKPIVSQPVKKFLPFYGTRSLFLVLERALHLTPIKLNSVHTFTSVSLRSLQTASSHPPLGPQSGLLPSSFSTKILSTFFPFLRLAYLIQFYTITLAMECWQPYQFHVRTVFTSGSLNLLKTSETVIGLYMDGFT
jgi:hypothetical protein